MTAIVLSCLPVRLCQFEEVLLRRCLGMSQLRLVMPRSAAWVFLPGASVTARCLVKEVLCKTFSSLIHRNPHHKDADLTCVNSIEEAALL